MGVMSHNSTVQSRGPFVVIEQPTEPRATTNSSSGLPVIDAVDERVAQRLMIALVMIVIDEFPDRPSEVPLADRNHPIETFLLDRSDESFRVCVRIRRLERCLPHAEASLGQQPLHLSTPFPIAIADQDAVIAQEPILNGRHG